MTCRIVVWFIDGKVTRVSYAYARKVQAEAEARAVHAIGKTQGFSLAQSVEAAGSADLYAAIIKANATTKWTGEVPEISLGPSSTGSESGHHPTERPGKVTL
jgi:hypothetical protein